jgi:hypothetical protein
VEADSSAFFDSDEQVLPRDVTKGATAVAAVGASRLVWRHYAAVSCARRDANVVPTVVSVLRIAVKEK